MERGVATKFVLDAVVLGSQVREGRLGPPAAKGAPSRPPRAVQGDPPEETLPATANPYCPRVGPCPIV